MNEIFNRYSLRSYLDLPVPPEVIDRLVKAGFQAPSAHDQQAWEVLVIQDREMLGKLAETSKYSICLKDAPLALVVLLNKTEMTAPEFWQQDLSALTQNVLIEAVHLGLAGVWLGVAPRRNRINLIRDVLELPENILPFGIISIGYPAKERTGRPRRYDNKIHYETYGTKG